MKFIIDINNSQINYREPWRFNNLKIDRMYSKFVILSTLLIY